MAGAGVVDVQGVDPDEGRARLDQEARRLGGQEGVALEVGVGAPVAVPAGADEHRLAADVVGDELVMLDGAVPVAGDIDRHGRDLGQPFEGKLG